VLFSRHETEMVDAASATASKASMESHNKLLAAAGYPAITTEIAPLPEDGFYYAEGYRQQYLARNMNGYCGLGGTGVACPVGAADEAFTVKG
jgi:peptide-methionine (S)-S-oxide reductase